MIKFKISKASANKAIRYHPTGPAPIERKPNDDIWLVTVRAEIMNPEDIKSQKHNKIMPIASTFFKIVRDDIGVKTEQLKVGPHAFSKNSWTCTFDVVCKENEEETLHYMVWWISSCVGRIYEV